MDKVKNFLLNLFFPKFCLGCEKEGSYLCDDCRATLDILEQDYFINSKNLSGLYFALPYKERPLTRKLIHSFKYQPYIKGLAKTLAGILIEHFVISGKNTESIWQNSILIPVPLDKKRLRSRGYNQSEELAKELAKVLEIPVILDVLIKTIATSPQMELSKKEREKNIKNAFAINPVRNLKISNGVKNPEAISGKKVFLVDDVYTTGATMEECAAKLLEAGAESVWGIAIAREE